MRSIVCRASGRFFSTRCVSGLGRLAEVHQRRVAERQDERREVDVRQADVGLLTRLPLGPDAAAIHSRPPSAGCDWPTGSACSATSGSWAWCFSMSLSVEHALPHVALANAHVPLPAVDGLGAAWSPPRSMENLLGRAADVAFRPMFKTSGLPSWSWSQSGPWTCSARPRRAPPRPARSPRGSRRARSRTFTE